MTKYASDLPDFADLLRAAADWKKQRAAIVEKDYYLTRALHTLSQTHRGKFILKGGTSLSKGWQLLQRFSEDIDLLVKTEPGWGKGRRDKRLKELQQTIAETKGFTLAEPVREASTGVHRTAIFSYHSVANDLAGLSKTIKLEMGYRCDAAAAVKCQASSMLAEYAVLKGLTKLADDLDSFEMDVQSVRRTFVEKLFAVHAVYTANRAIGKTRHYYDLFEMCKLTEIRVFVGTADYRSSVAQVRAFSQEMFAGQVLPETDSFSTSEAFQPDADSLKELERNYRLEADLFFEGQPTLAEVLQAIAELLPKL